MHQRRSEADEDFGIAEGAYGWRLVKRIALVTGVLALALILVSFRVPGAAVVAIVALGGLLVLLWFGPWLGAHRRKP